MITSLWRRGGRAAMAARALEPGASSAAACHARQSTMLSRRPALRWIFAAALSSAALDGARATPSPRSVRPGTSSNSPGVISNVASSLRVTADALFGGLRDPPTTRPSPLLTFAVRLAIGSDLVEMKRINEAVLPENYPLEFYATLLSDWPGLQLVACAPDASGSVVGYCLGKMEAAGRGHITSIAVLPEHANRGCATAIMREVTAEMRRRYGAEFVTLNVRKSNAAAIHVYVSKLGYRAETVYARYYANGEDALHLVLPIVPEPAAADRGASELVGDAA